MDSYFSRNIFKIDSRRKTAKINRNQCGIEEGKNGKKENSKYKMKLNKPLLMNSQVC